MTATDLSSPRVPPDVLAAEGFDPAESAGLFIGVSSFDDERFAEIPFAVDDAVDLASLFVHELRLVGPEKVVLGLAGEPCKPESAAAVIDGLRGQADVDERGLITVRTLADYLNRRVAAWVRDHRPDHATVSRGIAQRLDCRSAYRSGRAPGIRVDYLGFRLVRTA